MRYVVFESWVDVVVVIDNRWVSNGIDGGVSVVGWVNVIIIRN